MRDDACALAKKHCQPCSGGTPPLTADECKPLLAQLKGWQMSDCHRLSKSLQFKNFQAAMDLANRIAVLAEEEGHHPDLLIRWGELKIELWTHAVDGLTESDFILAAKIDELI